MNRNGSIHYRMISADSHVNEPPNTWVDRLPAKLKDRAPHVVTAEDGGEAWVFDEGPIRSFGLNSAAFQKGTVRGPEQYIPTGLKFEDLSRGSWDPKQHIADMKKDGADASVLYFWAASNCWNLKDEELRLACIRAYNDWLGEFESYDRARLIGAPMLPSEEEDIKVALDELQRNVKQYGVRTAQIPIFPWKRYHDAWYDPLWAMAEEMEIPLAIHRGLSRPFAFGMRDSGGPWMANQLMRDFSYSMPIGDMIFGGVFDRFPKLKLVSAEGRTGWLIGFVERADESFRRHQHWLKIDLKRVPSDYVKENIYSTFIEDRAGIVMRDLIGTDNQMWSSDYPHSDSSWPHSRDSLKRQLQGVSRDDRYKLLAGNAVRIYHLDRN